MTEQAFNKILDELKDIKESNSSFRKDFKDLKASNEKDFKDLKASNEKILKDFQDFKVAQERQVKELKTVLNKIKEENLELKKTVNQLIKKSDFLETEVSNLHGGLNRLQQEQLADQFVIPGIPFVDGEDLPTLIIKIGALLKVDLTKPDFSVIRLKSNKKPSTTLLVNSYKKKILFENRKKTVILLEQLGIGSSSKSKEVYFYHQLTKFNHDLLSVAKAELKTNNLVKFVWFQNNQVLVRQHSKAAFHSVHSKKDILTLATSFKEVIDLVSDQTE